MQKKYLKYIVLGIILGILAVPAVTKASNPTPEEALANLNAWRAETGEQPVSEMKPEWNHNCEMHNRYMAATGEFTHYENPASPFYTPEGAEGGAHSDLFGVPTLPRSFEEAVYHRVQLLNPRLNVSGFDASQGSTCVHVLNGNDESRTTPALTPYVWPPNGRTGVPTTFRMGEIPDPRAFDPNGGDLGFLLSVNLNGPWHNPRYVANYATSKSLVGSDGSTDELVFKDLGDGAFGLFPADPLHANVSYQVHVIGQSVYETNKQSYPFDIAWQFRTNPVTESDEEEPAPANHRRRRHHRRRHHKHHRRHHHHRHHHKPAFCAYTKAC